MVEKIVSPGVYSYENDQTFNPPGQSQTGLAVVGPTEKGEAFVPTDVASYTEFIAKFGAGGVSYVPQTVFSYLEAGSTVKVTRVLGNGGWSFTPSKKLAALVTPPSVSVPPTASSVLISTSSIFSSLYTASAGNEFYSRGNIIVDGDNTISFTGYPNSNSTWGTTSNRYWNSSGSSASQVVNNLVSGINAFSSYLNITASYGGGANITLTALTAGTVGNAYEYAVVDYDPFIGTIASGSFSGGVDAILTAAGKILTVFHPSLNDAPQAASLNSSAAVGSNSSFLLTLSGTGVSKQTSASLDVSSQNYITKVLGTDAHFQNASAFPHLNFQNYYSSNVSGSSAVSLVTSNTAITFTSSYSEGYDNAKTPWVLSEAGVRLFRFVHRSHGTKTNKDVKISISNIRVPAVDTQYTTFDVLVRGYNDTDAIPSIIEQYTGVTLDPNSANYILNVIGDTYSEYNSTLGKVVTQGDFPNISSYIRVEATDAVKEASVPENTKPNGFEAMYETIAGFTGYVLPAVTYRSSNSGSATFSGFDYSITDNHNYLNPVPQQATTGSNVNFTLPVNDNKFTLGFQYGTDGMNFATKKLIGSDIAANGTNVFGYDLSTSTSAGTNAYVKALSILSNNEEYFFDLLAVPGVIDQYHSAVTSVAESVCEDRTDAVYIRDIAGQNAAIPTVVSLAGGIDSSYSAAYYPWVKVKDLNSTKFIFVPPSVVVPQTFAYNDRVGAEWTAPAGVNRGVLSGVVDTNNRLKKSERDTLYEARINPITKFPNTNVLIYGQKTLQVKDTALNRLNVRRSLIAIRRYISDISKNLVFENNTIATRNRFLATVNPYLETVQNREGLYAFRVVMDDTNNTADVIDRNQLIGQIYLQPTKTAEFIILEFNVQPTGATFA